MSGKNMQQSFFTDIQNKFSQAFRGDEASHLSDFQGRYLGHIIHAVAQKHPALLQALLEGKGGRVTHCEPEYRYSLTVLRYADLALFRGDEATPFALVEIKANDGVNSEHNDSQLDDYISWAKQRGTHGRKIIVLTQYPLPFSTREKIKEHPGVTFELSVSKFADAVRCLPDKTKKSELVGMLLQYLLEKGLVMAPFTAGDISALHTFLIYSFLPHLSYHGKASSSERVANGPRAFSTLVQNWQLLSQRVADSQRTSLGTEGKRRPVVKFVTRPKYLPKVDLTADGNPRESQNKKDGGSWCIYAQTVLTQVGNRRLHLEYGLELSIEKGGRDDTKPSFDIHGYAALTHAGKTFGYNAGKSLRPSSEVGTKTLEVYASSLSNEKLLMKLVRNLIDKACTRALTEIKDLGSKAPKDLDMQVEHFHPHLIALS